MTDTELNDRLWYPVYLELRSNSTYRSDHVWDVNFVWIDKNYGQIINSEPDSGLT